MRILRSILALTLLAAMSPRSVAQVPSPGSDALHRRALAELDEFTRWLADNEVDGFIGEIGWPDDVRGEQDSWNDLAQDYYQAADDAGLWVSVWASGEWFHDYPLSVYEDLDPDVPGLDSANTQAAVVEAHPTTANYMRGVQAAGGGFCGNSIEPTSTMSNHDPGPYNRCYHYDSQETFDFLAAHGVKLVRIDFRWEALQRKLGRPLNKGELGRLRGVVGRANNAGITVVIEPHNFGGYYLWDGEQGVRRALGSRKLPVRHFVDLWRRISKAFKSNPDVLYDLMNEPVEMSGGGGLPPVKVWERASQSALDAIRANGDDKTVMVPGYEWSAILGWADRHQPWITDPANSFRYEAHHYWNCDRSGNYGSYASEVRCAEDEGY